MPREMEEILPAEPLDWADKAEVVRGSIGESEAVEVVERRLHQRGSVLLLIAIPRAGNGHAFRDVVFCDGDEVIFARLNGVVAVDLAGRFAYNFQLRRPVG